jgi:hypothetical protein
MRAQRADIKIDALCMPLALFGHAVRATARGEQMRTVLGDVIVWRRCGARCAARVHTHITLGWGPDQPMAARRAADAARVLIFERIHRELVSGCGRLPHESEPLAVRARARAARYARTTSPRPGLDRGRTVVKCAAPGAHRASAVRRVCCRRRRLRRRLRLRSPAAGTATVAHARCSRRAEQPATSQQALTAAALRRHVCRPRRRALAALAAAAPAAALAAAVAVCNPKPSPRENPRCTQKILRKLKNSKPPFFQSHRISSHSHVSIID